MLNQINYTELYFSLDVTRNHFRSGSNPATYLKIFSVFLWAILVWFMIRGLIWLKACPDFHAPAGCHCAGAGGVSWDWVMLRDGNCLPQIHPLKHWSCGCLENQTGWETPRNTTRHHKDCFELCCLANLRKREAGTFLPNKHYQWNSSDTLFLSFTTYISARVQFQYQVYSILVKLMTSLDFRFGFPICKSLHGIGISAQAWQPHRAFLKTPRKASGEVTSFIASW